MSSRKSLVVFFLVIARSAMAIDLSDNPVIVGKVPGTQKIVTIIDDSTSMETTMVSPASNGGAPIDLWSYYRHPMIELYKHVEEVDFAITRMHGVWHATPEHVLEGITGTNTSGSVNPTLEAAINSIFDDDVPHSGTPLREPLANAGRFLLCKPGTRNLLVRGVYEDVVSGSPPGGVSKRDCWNVIDYNVDTEAQACSKHSLWAFTDGGFYPPPGDLTYNDGDRTMLPNFYNSYLTSQYPLMSPIDHMTDGISTRSLEGPLDSWSEYGGASAAHPTDHIGFSDIAKYLVNIAEDGEFNFEFNFVLMTREGVFNVTDPRYSLNGSLTQPLSLNLLERICIERGGTGTCEVGSPPASSHWDWMASHFARTPYWPENTAVEDVFVFSHGIRDDPNDPVTGWDEWAPGAPWHIAAGFDTMLGLWHLKQAGMLGHVFVDDPNAFEAEIPELISRVGNRTVARAAVGGLAVNGSEVEDPDKVFQPYFADDASDVYSYEIVDDAALDGNLAYAQNAADEMPNPSVSASPTRNLWTVVTTHAGGGYRRPLKIPETGPMSLYNRLEDWYSAAQELVANVQERAMWLLNSDVPDLRPRPLTTDLPDPATNAAVPSFIGDIVNSKPIHAGGAFFENQSNKEAYLGAPSYETFRTSVAGRRKMLYAGSNSAMLHGFDAETMRERFAYIPSKLLLNDESTGNHVVARMQEEDYDHAFGVDATPVVQDVLMRARNCPSGQSRCWRTVLANGLRQGGRGYFMLDVTFPGVFANNNTESENAILWEYSTADHLGDELGFSFPAPVIHGSYWKQSGGDYKWVMAFGNGVNSASGDAYFYALAIDRTPGPRQNWNGSNVVRIQVTNGSTDNGLLSPIAVDLNKDDLIDYYYAGDMHGNVYRIDARSNNPVNWTVHRLYNSETTSTDFAVDSAPLVVKANGGREGVMVVFANGHVYNSSALIDGQTKSVFGIWDEDPENNTLEIRRSDLQTQVFEYRTLAGREVRGFDKDLTPPDYAGGQKGWVVDLLGPTSNQLGERMISLAFHKGAVVASSHAVRDLPEPTAATARQCIPLEYPGYVSVFDPNNGGAKFGLVRFATADGIESSAGDGAAFLVTSVRVASAPSSITLSKTDKAYFQDAKGNIEQVLIEGANGGEEGVRLAWKRLG